MRTQRRLRDRARDVQRHRPLRIEPRGAGAVEVRRVQRQRGSARVGEVEDDEIVERRRAADEREPVVDDECQAGIVEHAAVDCGEVLARDVDDGGVDLAQRHRLQRRVLEKLLGGAAVAAADDERLPRHRMGERGHVNEVFVAEELVLLRRHEVAVEPVEPAERTRCRGPRSPGSASGTSRARARSGCRGPSRARVPRPAPAPARRRRAAAGQPPAAPRRGGRTSAPDSRRPASARPRGREATTARGRPVRHRGAARCTLVRIGRGSGAVNRGAADYCTVPPMDR